MRMAVSSKSDFPPIQLPAKTRAEVRRAICNSVGWKAYRKRTGVSIAHMTRDDVLKAARALGINVNRILRLTGRAKTPRGIQIGHRDGPPLGAASVTSAKPPTVDRGKANLVQVDRDLFSGEPILIVRH